MMNTVNEILAQINRAINQNKRIILGIDGLSRSGKTTLVKRIASILAERGIECSLIHLDDHIVGKSKRYNTGLEEWREYYFLQWDVATLKETLFESLIHSDEVQLPFYDNDKDQHVNEKLKLTGKNVFIVEGVFLQRDEWKPYVDYTVFIDCPREIRFARESSKTQQNIEKFRRRYWKAEDYYIDQLRPAEKADLVIPYGELIN